MNVCRMAIRLIMKISWPSYEEAIASLEKRNMKNLFMTVLDNKYEEAAMFMLQPEDFKNINIPD